VQDGEPPPRLTHVTPGGEAHMVDVGEKAVTAREAVARGHVAMQPGTLDLIQRHAAGKGDVLGVARIAAIMAAKRTWDLIPLCHALPLTAVDVSFAFDEPASRVEITARAATSAQTGVEMEALTAVSVAALTIYDMCKAADRAMTIGDIRLTYKSGGKSGTFIAE
jgi:cyclic pyranopterin phosphate synthase